jgi:hypothetical protein
MFSLVLKNLNKHWMMLLLSLQRLWDGNCAG